MSDEKTDLTYGDFVKLRAQALRSLHAAQAFQAAVRDRAITTTIPTAEEAALKAVEAAQMLLTTLLDRWNRSRYNRSE